VRCLIALYGSYGGQRKGDPFGPRLVLNEMSPAESPSLAGDFCFLVSIDYTNFYL
jgi:hypothetical protein